MEDGREGRGEAAGDVSDKQLSTAVRGAVDRGLGRAPGPFKQEGVRLDEL